MMNAMLWQHDNGNPLTLSTHVHTRVENKRSHGDVTTARRVARKMARR